MLIYPAIDLMGGRCVRLVQGRFDEATFYPSDPEEALAGFAEAGAAWAHVVDLDGARNGEPAQHDSIVRLAGTAPLALQVAGGFRTRDHVARMFDAGVGRVVIGSLAVTDPPRVRALFDEFGSERLAIALDVNLIAGEPIVATRGWTESSGTLLYDVALGYALARHLVVTDIGRDGMLRGPNLKLVREASAKLSGRALQFSGGVAELADIARLKKIGAAGAVVGKALWEGGIDLAGAVRLARA